MKAYLSNYKRSNAFMPDSGAYSGIKKRGIRRIPVGCMIHLKGSGKTLTYNDPIQKLGMVKGRLLASDFGLIYYNYRHCNPLDGRWCGRDFIQKTENKNPYLFIFNKLPFDIDIFGLFMSSGCCAAGPENLDLMPRCPKGAKTRESGYFDFSLSSYHCAGKQYEYRTTEQKKGYRPTSNGCGAEGGTKVRGDFYLFDITPACNAHDICYGTCGSNKSLCDSKFFADIMTICTKRVAIPYLCYNLASIYSGAVLGWGNSAYEAAQDEACEWAPCTI